MGSACGMEAGAYNTKSEVNNNNNHKRKNIIVVFLARISGLFYIKIFCLNKIQTRVCVGLSINKYT